MALMPRAVFTACILLASLGVTATAAEAPTGVLPWPGTELNSYGLSYLSAVLDEARDLNRAWIVFSDREGNYSYTDRDCTVKKDALGFLQSFHIRQIDPQRGVANIVEAEIAASEGFRTAPIVKDRGWIQLDRLALSDRPFRDPSNFIPQRALVVTDMSTHGIAEVPKLYSQPSSDAEVLRALKYTEFFYVYKVLPGDVEGGRYDPRYGYAWYLVGGQRYWTARPGVNGGAVAPNRGAVGWLRGSHALIWSTRQALEPTVGRTRDAHVFGDSQAALRYAVDSTATERVMLKDSTTRNRSWPSQRFRYPLLGQRPVTQQGAEARLIAYQGQVDMTQGDTSVDHSHFVNTLYDLKTSSAHPRILFVLDATVSMCDYIAITLSAAKAIVDEVSGDHDTHITVGLVLYKDRVDGYRETQVFPATEDFDELLERKELRDCSQARDGDFEESVFKGIYDAWDKAGERNQDSFVTYVVMGDTGRSSNDTVTATRLVEALSGAYATGSHSHFALHAIRIMHPADSPREARAMEAFRTDLHDTLIRRLDEVTTSALAPQNPSPHSYTEFDVTSPAARRRVAQQAAKKIEDSIALSWDMTTRLETSITDGTPLIPQGDRASGDGLPVATSLMKIYLERELGKQGLDLATQQRSQIFYRGWVPTRARSGESVMSPVLFLNRREAGDLLGIVDDVAEYQDCQSFKEYIQGLIGAVSPEDVRLSINVLLAKKKGIQFRSPLLDLSYEDIEALCDSENARKFSKLILDFADLADYLKGLFNAPDGSEAYARHYRLGEELFYWFPMDKLP